MDVLHAATEFASRDLGLGGRGSSLVIPSIIGPIIAGVLVFNRVYWRLYLVHSLGLDDVCITLSLVFLFAHCIVNLIAVDHGYGRAATSLSREDMRMAFQMFYLDQIFYKFTINLTKLSILCLYLRIFSQTWFRRTCWTCAILVLCYAFSSIIATACQCTPIQRFWDRDLPGTCINTTIFWRANAIYNILTDVIILASVPPVVLTLRLPMRQRLGLTAVFGLGIFVFATSILRMTTLDTSSKSPDPLYGTLKSTMWTTIEASAAVICACLPMLRTPAQRFFPRLFPISGYSSAESRTSPTNTSAGDGGAGTKDLRLQSVKNMVDHDADANPAPSCVKKTPGKIVVTTTTDLEVGRRYEDLKPEIRRA